MSNVNLAFCRQLFKLVLMDVRKLATPEEIKAAWVYHFERDNWEFHGPNGFYWYGSADNAYDARANGWQAWLDHCHPDRAT